MHGTACACKTILPRLWWRTWRKVYVPKLQHYSRSGVVQLNSLTLIIWHCISHFIFQEYLQMQNDFPYKTSKPCIQKWLSYHIQFFKIFCLTIYGGKIHAHCINTHTRRNMHSWHHDHYKIYPANISHKDFVVYIHQ